MAVTEYSLENPPELGVGEHTSPEDGFCVMEWVSVLSGGVFTDLPKCTSVRVARVAQCLNDEFDWEHRQKLHRLVPKIMACRPNEGVTLRANAALWSDDARFAALREYLTRDWTHKDEVLAQFEAWLDLYAEGLARVDAGQ